MFNLRFESKGLPNEQSQASLVQIWEEGRKGVLWIPKWTLEPPCDLIINGAKKYEVLLSLVFWQWQSRYVLSNCGIWCSASMQSQRHWARGMCDDIPVWSLRRRYIKLNRDWSTKIGWDSFVEKSWERGNRNPGLTNLFARVYVDQLCWHYLLFNQI